MICGRCDQDFFGSQCSCGWKAPMLEPVREPDLWEVRECEAEGCTTMIRERPGAVGSRFCKWCAAQGIKAEKIHYLNNDDRYITREQFGETLYRVIGLFSGRDQVRKYYKQQVTNLDLSVEQRKRVLADLKKREVDLTAQITELIPMLEPEDVRRLLRTYEEEPAA